MSAQVETFGPRVDFERETRYGRPLIMPPTGGKPVPYTRVTTFVSVAEDLYNLQRWEKRQVAIGLGLRRDLLLAVQSTDRDDKGKLDRLCDEAKEAAGAHAAATTGTALHALTELPDTGRPLPEGLDSDTLRSMEAYVRTTEPLRCDAVEVQLVQDWLKVAGTADRLVTYDGRRYVADIKTGSSIELGIGKIAGQLAAYARSKLYDVATNERADHGASIEWGLIIHLPASDPGTCALVWVDLLQGWEWVKTCRDIRDKRSLRFGQLTRPFAAGAQPPTVAQPSGRPTPPPLATTAGPPTLVELIEQVASEEEGRELWKRHRADWTPQLTEHMRAHLARLKGGAA